MIVLAFVVLLTGLALAYFSRAGTDRQLAQSSYNDTSADLLARSALDIVVGDFKQEIINDPTCRRPENIQPARYGDASIPNLIRRSFSGDPTNRTSSVSSSAAICERALNQHNSLEQPLLNSAREHGVDMRLILPLYRALRTRLGARNCSRANSGASTKCCDRKICVCGLRRGRVARYECGRLSQTWIGSIPSAACSPSSDSVAGKCWTQRNTGFRRPHCLTLAYRRTESRNAGSTTS